MNNGITSNIGMDEGDTTETNIDNSTIVGKNTVRAMVARAMPFYLLVKI